MKKNLKRSLVLSYICAVAVLLLAGAALGAAFGTWTTTVVLFIVLILSGLAATVVAVAANLRLENLEDQISNMKFEKEVTERKARHEMEAKERKAKEEENARQEAEREARLERNAKAAQEKLKRVIAARTAKIGRIGFLVFWENHKWGGYEQELIETEGLEFREFPARIELARARVFVTKPANTDDRTLVHARAQELLNEWIAGERPARDEK